MMIGEGRNSDYPVNNQLRFHPHLSLFFHHSRVVWHPLQMLHQSVFNLQSSVLFPGILLTLEQDSKILKILHLEQQLVEHPTVF